jgi:GNAT superfamily N-acetyltransferase
MIEIHALLPHDWQVIRDIRLRSLHESPHAFTSSLAREAAFDESTWRQRATTGHWFVAVEDEEPIGVAAGVDGWSGDATKRELVGMWVAPGWRGRGVARLLIGAVSTWARSEDASTLSLGVREGNQAARAVYVALGLRTSGETMAERDQPGRSIEIMELDLTSDGGASDGRDGTVPHRRAAPARGDNWSVMPQREEGRRSTS